MEQRRLRLGDILDDYCPRERRVTNHAVVAMIEEDVKQTRCTTCDAEHAYKGGKAPRRKKKDGPAALYDEVLAGMPENEAAPNLTSSAPSDATPQPQAAAPVNGNALSPAEPLPTDTDSEERGPEVEAQIEPQIEDGPVHRPLIRATLPRPEGQKDARPLPDFTVRQAGGRGNGHFRGGDMRPKHRGQGGEGNRVQGSPRFAAGARSGGPGRGIPGRGPGGNFRGPQAARRGGKKRSR